MRTDYPLLLARKLPRDNAPIYQTLPSRVPFKLVRDHEKQAMCNHYQTLERLAQRGGLAPCEMLAVIEDRPWRSMGDEEAATTLLKYIDETHKAGEGK